MVTIQFMKLTTDATIPKFVHESDAGMDIYSCENVIIPVGKRRLVRTGLAMQFKYSWYETIIRKLFGTKYELQARCKSGRALKEGFMLTNGVGTIDEDYRGELGCIITNTGMEPIVIEKGQKIFQGVVNKLPNVKIEEVCELKYTKRGKGGFGSTGLND